MRRATGFAQAAGHARRRNCAEIEMQNSIADHLETKSGHDLNRAFSRLTLAMLLSLTLTLGARAETVADTVSQWGLIGSWSLDCSLAAGPEQGRGAGSTKFRRTAGCCIAGISAAASTKAK